MNVTGFGDSKINGTYVSSGTFCGYTAYYKGTTAILAYYDEFGPYSLSGGYYLISVNQVQGSVPLLIPEYRISGTSPTATGWKSLLSVSSGANTIGTVA